MASCLASNLTEVDCGGRGTPCLVDLDGKFTCSCVNDYVGFAEFNPEPNNCDVYIPALYFLGSLIILVDIVILGLVYWAIKVRTIPQFISLLRKKNAPAAMTVTALFTAFAQMTWVAFRLSDIQGRAIGVDAPTTVSFAISLFLLYFTAPHVLRHYAKLTFSESRIMMLNMVGREKAKARAKVARPLILGVLPFFTLIASFSPCVGVVDLSLTYVGLKIMAVSTALFLAFTLVLIRVLITPMVRDMKYAVSVKRLSSADQEVLEVATRKLILFEYLIVIVSAGYIPIMLLWGFVPALRSSVTYIFFFGAMFCGIICAFSVWTLTNVASTRSQPCIFRSKRKKGKGEVQNIQENAVITTATPKD